MSCSCETVEEEELIQIRPAITAQLKKAKYGVADHSTVGLCHWTKKSFKHEGSCYKPQVLWNFDPQVYGVFSGWHVLREQMCILLETYGIL